MGCVAMRVSRQMSVRVLIEHLFYGVMPNGLRTGSLFGGENEIS